MPTIWNPTQKLLPLDIEWDSLLLQLYGTVGYLRDLEAMRADGKKPQPGTYSLIHETAEMRVFVARRNVIDFALKNDAFYTEAYRALRYSHEPLIAGLAQEMKRRRTVV